MNFRFFPWTVHDNPPPPSPAFLTLFSQSTRYFLDPAVSIRSWLAMDSLQGMKLEQQKVAFFFFLRLCKKYFLTKNGKIFKWGFLLKRSRHVIKQAKNAADKLIKLIFIVQLCYVLSDVLTASKINSILLIPQTNSDPCCSFVPHRFIAISNTNFVSFRRTKVILTTSQKLSLIYLQYTIHFQSFVRQWTVT